MAQEKLHGVIVPVITPVDHQENVDETAFRTVLRRLIDAGVHGIFVGGSAGEGPLLADRQWRRMAEIACDEVGGRIPLLGGAIDTSTRKVCEKITALKDIGYRYFVVTPTFYTAIKTPQEHLRLFGRARNAGADMEMLPYNIPQCTGSALSVDTMCEMARRGWVRYCKESSGDWAYLSELIPRGKDCGLTVLAGDELTSGKALLAGARGIVPVCANFEPSTYVQLYDAGTQGNRDRVAQVMIRVEELRQQLLFSGPCWLTGIKYALSALGIGNGLPLSPLEPIDEQRKMLIDELIRAAE